MGKNNELEIIDKETKLKNSYLKVTENSVNERNMKLQEALKQSKLSRKGNASSKHRR